MTRFPSRAEVSAKWLEVSLGALSRTDAHGWAQEFLESLDSPETDLMVMNALQHLHGFDISMVPEGDERVAHGVSQNYIHSLEEIGQARERWFTRCQKFDANSDNLWRGQKAAHFRLSIPVRTWGRARKPKTVSASLCHDTYSNAWRA